METITVKEACAATGWPEGVIRGQIACGNIPVERDGRRVRVRLQDVQDYIQKVENNQAARRQGPSPAEYMATITTETMTLQQVAEAMGMNESTLRGSLTHPCNLLPAVKVDGRWQFKTDDVTEYLFGNDVQELKVRMLRAKLEQYAIDGDTGAA